MKVSIETITPAKAKAYLKKSVNFRKSNPRKIKAMIRDMDNELWECNGESLKWQTIDGAECLVDGQNRLLALSQSKCVGMQFVVVRDIESSDYVDTGREAKSVAVAEASRHRLFQ